MQVECSLADLEAFLACLHGGSSDLVQPIIGVHQLLHLTAGAVIVGCDVRNTIRTL